MIINSQHTPNPHPNPDPSILRLLIPIPGFNKDFGPGWPTLCDDVRELIGNLSTLPTVKCIDPSSQSILAQVIDAQEASIIVAEHGTLSYSALYARDGTILITIGSELHLKEPHVLSFITYLHVFYMVYERKNDLEGLVHHAFQLLVKNNLFNLAYDITDRTYKHRQDVVKQDQCTITTLLSNQQISNDMSYLKTGVSTTYYSILGDDGKPIGIRYNLTLMYGDNENIVTKQNDVVHMDFLYGASVHQKMTEMFPNYRSFPYSVFVDFSYTVSEQLYGVYYTPTLSAETTARDDYECNQICLIAKIVSGTRHYVNNSVSYLEFSSDRTILFDKVSKLFDHAVHNNLTHAHFHNAETDGLYNIIFIGRLLDARKVFQYVKGALQMLDPSGCIVFQDVLPGHKLHASYPREPGSSVWYGTTWKVQPTLCFTNIPSQHTPLTHSLTLYRLTHTPMNFGVAVGVVVPFHSL